MVEKIMGIIRNFIKFTFDNTFGIMLLLLKKLQFFQFHGYFLAVIGYRARYMVNRGDNVLLAGIFSTKNIFEYSNEIGLTGRVLVVEANPQNTKRLKIECKSLKNVTIINAALWNKKGEIEFLCLDQNEKQGYNRIKSSELNEFPDHFGVNPSCVRVKSDTIKNICNEHNFTTLDHLNLTINGAELQALEIDLGLTRQFSNIRIYINCEYPYPFNDVLESLKNQNFYVQTSKLINTVNTKIKLRRIYAIYKK
jgi:FkbM family methyltransferase